MNSKINLTIHNNLCVEPRTVNVYHHVTGSAHMISHNSFITLPLHSVTHNDYIYISIVNGPGPLCRPTVIDLPAWTDFDFTPGGELNLTHSHDGNRIRLNVQPGHPNWQLKLRQPTAPGKKSADTVSIGTPMI